MPAEYTAEENWAVPLPLTGGGVTLVDRDVWEWARAFSWRPMGSHDGMPGYAARTQRQNGRSRPIYLHREILRPPPGYVTDHINGDRWDNRRANLRAVTHSQNRENLSPFNPRSRSGYRNVVWSGAGRCWLVEIRVGGRLTRGGRFGRFEDAVAAAQELRARLMPHAAREASA